MAAIEAIASAVLRPDAFPANGASLSHGTAGAALFFASLSNAHPHSRERISQTAVELLERSIATMALQSLPPALYGGFTGIAWTVGHLQAQLFQWDQDEDPNTAIQDEDPNTAIDDALGEFVAQTPWRGHFDLIGGLVGYGLYALDRRRFPSGVSILESVIERLRENAVTKPDGVAWYTGPELLPQWQKDRHPDGYYNLGLAHGAPGVIALLGQVCAAGVAVEKARPLLDSAVSWLLSQENPEGSPSCFGTVAIGQENGRRQHARLAWCYGDLGIAAALLWAARSVGEVSWERDAIRIGMHAATRTFEQSGVVDAGLCHGAAGNGHLFNRLYQATREQVFLDAARFWFAQALALRQPGAGVAGFLAWDGMDGGKWSPDPGLLEGAVGIGLALLAAVDSTPPDWDRILLVSVPPR